MSRYLIAILPFAIAALAPIVAAFAQLSTPDPLSIAPRQDRAFQQAQEARDAAAVRSGFVYG